MKTVSVVLPCYNESQNLLLLVPQIIKEIPKKYNLEIICVDDGSSDATEKTIRLLASTKKNVRGIIFQKRFGHQQALRAGIKKAKGEAIIMMDADFQHPVTVLKTLLARWEAGHDLVQAVKKEDQQGSFLFKLQRQFGYTLWLAMSDGILIPGASDFRLISRRIADYINRLNEREIFLRGLVMQAARKPAFVKYKPGTRIQGKSSYTHDMFVNMFLNGLVSFSSKPLRIAWIIGLVVTFGACIYLIGDILVAGLIQRRIIEGWKTIVTLLLVLNGFIILYLGLLGEYLSIIFKEVKARPKYLVKKTVNLD